MVAARFYKTRKIKGAQVLGNDPDETWFCVRARNFSKKEHKEFKNRRDKASLILLILYFHVTWQNG